MLKRWYVRDDQRPILKGRYSSLRRIMATTTRLKDSPSACVSRTRPNADPRKMSSAPPEKPSREETVCRALNEHGFLFQERITELFTDNNRTKWKVAATEFPVSLLSHAVHEETRIDLVLERHVAIHNVDWHLPIECKRANPDYKTWLFFNERSRVDDPANRSLYVQAGYLSGGWNQQGEVPLQKYVTQFAPPKSVVVPTFNYYLEARENPPQRAASSASTKTLEEAFNQVTMGAVGLGRQLHHLQKFNFRIVPVVVTTAEVFAADFKVGNVSLQRGELSHADLSLRPLDWLVVNYAISDTISQFAALTSNRGRTLGEQLSTFMLRSVFVVRAGKLEAFLDWFDQIADLNPR